MKFRRVLVKDGRLFRLCRFVWTRGCVGDGNGYSCKLSFGLTPCVFYFRRFREIETVFHLVVLGLRIRLCRSFGGIYD